jgi:hypothetical protein
MDWTRDLSLAVAIILLAAAGTALLKIGAAHTNNKPLQEAVALS